MTAYLWRNYWETLFPLAAVCPTSQQWIHLTKTQWWEDLVLIWLLVWTNCGRHSHHMMTSSNGNIFRVTVPLCGPFFHLRLNKRLSKQSWDWWLETPPRSLWHHCNDIDGWWWFEMALRPLDVILMWQGIPNHANWDSGLVTKTEDYNTADWLIYQNHVPFLRTHRVGYCCIIEDYTTV